MRLRRRLLLSIRNDYRHADVGSEVPAMPKILYFVPEDWAFVSHFRPMAQAADACGLEVVVATRVHRHAEAIVGEGYRLVPLKSQRGSLNPLGLLKSISEMA